MTQAELDHQFMRQAIEQAQLAALEGEVPVGAVLVRDGRVISKAFNQPITHHDPSAHAEMLALRLPPRPKKTIVYLVVPFMSLWNPARCALERCCMRG